MNTVQSLFPNKIPHGLQETDPQGYTKHYYAESERITTQLGKYRFAVVDSCVAGDSLAHIKLQNAAQAFPTDSFPTPTPMLGYLHSLTNHPNTASSLYFYHPDHLGSASWITNIYGRTIQHLYYLPWGEDFVNQRTGSFSSMYTFSAKEKDTETGYSYFGSRYYSSDLSIWLSVDPMAHKYPSLSPYVYCANNPVKLVDPDGEEIFDDIVIHGKNKSSITIKTSLIDLELNANVDFGGNYTLSSENVALGFQTEFVATGQAGIGTSYGGFKSKIMFFGGDYSGYWYDYIGGDMQVLCGVSVEASVGFQTSLVLGIYTGEKGGNTPMSFAGAYTGLSCSAGLKATLCGINLNASSSKALNNKWDVFTFGVSFTQGYQGGIGLSIGSEFGSAKLITKQIPTKDRTIRDRVKNILSH